MSKLKLEDFFTGEFWELEPVSMDEWEELKRQIIERDDIERLQEAYIVEHEGTAFLVARTLYKVYICPLG